MEKSKSRLKVFLENIFVYGLFSVLNKIVPVIMLPIVTRLLTDTSNYGAYSMFTTIQSFAVQFALLGLYDAVFREYFEKDDNKFHSVVLSTGMNIVLVSSIVVGAVLVIFADAFSVWLLGDSSYKFVIIAAGIDVFFGAARTMLMLPTRIKNKRKIYVLISLAESIVTYILIMLLILWFNMNYNGMIYATVISTIMVAATYFVLNKKEFEPQLYQKSEAKELLKIGIPLIPNFVVYWVFNSFDKVMISNMLGLGELGIFSIGSRVASVSHIVYTAYSAGLQYFVFSTMKDKDQTKLISRIIESLSALTMVLFLVATTVDEPVFRWIFDGDYELGYTVFPYLLLAPLLQMIYQTAGNQLLVYKKGYLSTICLATGAVLNIVMNYYFIQWHGIKGAALATLFGYLISIMMIMIITTRKKYISLSWRPIALLAIVIGVSLKIYFADDVWSHVIALSCAVLVVIMYRKDIMKAFSSMRRMLTAKKSRGKV